MSTTIFLFLLVSITFVVVAAFLTGYISNRRNINATTARLRESDRTVALPDAIRLCKEGMGDIFRNQTTLPGKFWFVRRQDESDQRSFWQFVNDEGKIIESVSKPSEKELIGLLELRDLVEPFED
ncbi:MAG: hypothetical protein ACI9G1_003881 [Pirellulaceae bacterium]